MLYNLRPRATTELSERVTPKFTSLQLWPPNSPDLNSVDYSVWEYSERRCTCTKHASLIWTNRPGQQSMWAEPASAEWTRNSLGDEIANVNFLYDDNVHVLQNTIDSCINSATYRRGHVLECRFPKFSEITQCNGHYAVQGHSRSPILVPIESSYTTSY